MIKKKKNILKKLIALWSGLVKGVGIFCVLAIAQLVSVKLLHVRISYGYCVRELLWAAGKL